MYTAILFGTSILLEKRGLPNGEVILTKLFSGTDTPAGGALLVSDITQSLFLTYQDLTTTRMKLLSFNIDSWNPSNTFLVKNQLEFVNVD
jgi:hypothetical protein